MLGRHYSHPAVLSRDIKAFFPSVSRLMVRERLHDLQVPPDSLEVIVRLTTSEQYGLPQGAPTSVDLADILLWPLDKRLSGLAKKKGLVYTRYVDDFAISGGSRVKRLEAPVERFAAECGWPLNEKGGYAGPGERHELLGAIVNTKPNVSKAYFNEVRSLVRAIASGSLEVSQEEYRSLVGKVAWIESLNPPRGERLRDLLNS